MYRLSAAALFLLCGICAAGAGSLLRNIESQRGESPSIVRLGTETPDPLEVETLDAAASIIFVSPSIVAYGIDAVPPTRENVAAIEDEDPAMPDWQARELPRVIRGGLFGEAFTDFGSDMRESPDAAPIADMDANGEPAPAQGAPAAEETLGRPAAAPMAQPL